MIVEYGDACRVDEMKGGGDPYDIPEIEARLALAQARVYGQVDKIQREIQ